MIDVLQKQKEILHSIDNNHLVKRDIVEYARKQLKHDLIKIITGPRRVGKSTLSLQILNKKKFGYVNFDDPDLDLKNMNYSELTRCIDKIYGNPNYILFDEIQNLPKWEVYLNSLQREKRNLVVTGSNAKMLSKDLATALTGRSIEIQLFPFSLNEAQITKSKLTIDQYLLEGNYPEKYIKEIDGMVYYQSLFSTSLIRDVMVRYSLRNPVDLENLAKYLLSTVTNTYSYQSIARKLNLTVPMVIDYIRYLMETYLFYELPRFSTKQSEVNRSNKKMYVVDFAFAKYNASAQMNNLGYALENAVFIELLRRKYVPGNTLFYYKTVGNYEVDFVTVERDRTLSLYQVSYNLDDDNTLAREVKSFQMVEKELLGVKALYMVTKGVSKRVIEGVNFLDFDSFLKQSPFFDAWEDLG